MRVGRKKTIELDELTDKKEKLWDTPKFRRSTITIDQLDVPGVSKFESSRAIVNMLDFTTL